MWRTWATLLSLLGLGAILLAANASGRADKPAPPAGSDAAPTAQPTAPAVESVPSASGAVLAEMTRRLGTPRRVSAASRRKARLIRRIEARILARRRAAAARAAAQAARARAAAAPSAPEWYDPRADSITASGPASPQEAAWLNSGRGGWVESSGYARAPVNAPDAIKRVIQAGNRIARSPYLWGGGHGQWRDKGYDCSGSVSFALAAGGMLGYSLTSGQLMGWGAPGPGRWLTIYANEGHVFMYVAGLRFDTSGRAGDHATRWQLAPRPADGFTVRHYPGL